VLLAGIIVSLDTKDGKLIVEVDQKDAIVQVLDDEGKVEIAQKFGDGKILWARVRNGEERDEGDYGKASAAGNAGMRWYERIRLNASKRNAFKVVMVWRHTSGRPDSVKGNAFDFEILARPVKVKPASYMYPAGLMLRDSRRLSFALVDDEVTTLFRTLAVKAFQGNRNTLSIIASLTPHLLVSSDRKDNETMLARIRFTHGFFRCENSLLALKALDDGNHR